jgi:hypothetical protein
MLIHDEETPLDEAVEPTHRESEEVKCCGQPMDTSTNLTREHDYIISRTTGAAVEVSFGPLPSGYVPKNPFASLAQAGYMHSHPEILGKEKLKEFDKASKGQHVPYKVKRK